MGCSHGKGAPELCYDWKMRANIKLVKSFTQNPEQGSPTGVVLDADKLKLTDAQMQHIAAELGFAESAFVQASAVADYRLRFFAPNQEVDLCGHATIASFHALLEQGRIQIDKALGKTTLVQQTRAGTLAVTCYSDGRIVMKQNDPQFGRIEENQGRIADMLGLIVGDLVCGLPAQIVSTGTPKLLVPLNDLVALRRVRPDLEAIKNYCHDTGARGIYPFTAQSPIAGADFYARQFNPLADENEDPITGVAAGALGCYAAKYNQIEGPGLVVAQGYDLGMGGNMFVDLSDGVQVGGYAVSYGETQVTVI